MPTNDLDAAVAAFDKARDELSEAQKLVREHSTAANNATLAKAQEAYKAAGQAVRRLKDPERAMDVLEFNRYLGQKQRLREQRQAKTGAAS